MVYSSRLFPKRANKFNTLLIFLCFLGLVIFLFGSYIKYKKTVLSFNQSPPESSEVKQQAGIPTNISIPELEIDLTIEESNITDGVWEVSETGASFLSSSARPGEGGNIVIYGHNKRRLFGNLLNRNLLGLSVQIKSSDNSTHEYEIIETKIVNPTDIEEVMPTKSEVLTLYTCTGILDSKRLIIKAKPINQN